jgi:hypothetical protein
MADVHDLDAIAHTGETLAPVFVECGPRCHTDSR